MKKNEDRTPHYRKDSLTLVGAVALGTGVMIGAGIFALTGQMAQSFLARTFGARLVFLITAIILDLIVLAGFIWIKMFSDPLVVGVAGAVMLAILIVEVLFLRHNPIVPKGHNHG